MSRLKASTGWKVGNHVNGEWVYPTGSDGQTVVNPATGEQLGNVRFTPADEVDDAIQSAYDAFLEWRNQPIEERIQPLFRLKQLLETHQNELAEMLVRDHGKTISEARGELHRGIENVEVACGIPTIIKGG